MHHTIVPILWAYVMVCQLLDSAKSVKIRPLKNSLLIIIYNSLLSNADKGGILHPGSFG